MLKSYQVGYEKMKNDNFGNFRPSPPLGGGEIGEISGKYHIFDKH